MFYYFCEIVFYPPLTNSELPGIEEKKIALLVCQFWKDSFLFILNFRIDLED